MRDREVADAGARHPTLCDAQSGCERGAPRRPRPRRSGTRRGACAGSPRGRGRAPRESSRRRRARARERSRSCPSGAPPARRARAAAGRRAGSGCSRTCRLRARLRARAARPRRSRGSRVARRRSRPRTSRWCPPRGRTGGRSTPPRTCRDVLDPTAVARHCRVRAVRLPRAAERDAVAAAASSTSASRLLMTAWLMRRDPDPLAVRDQIDDQASTEPGLAGAGRPLDDERRSPRARVRAHAARASSLVWMRLPRAPPTGAAAVRASTSAARGSARCRRARRWPAAAAPRAAGSCRSARSVRAPAAAARPRSDCRAADEDARRSSTLADVHGFPRARVAPRASAHLVLLAGKAQAVLVAVRRRGTGCLWPRARRAPRDPRPARPRPSPAARTSASTRVAPRGGGTRGARRRASAASRSSCPSTSCCRSRSRGPVARVLFAPVLAGIGGENATPAGRGSSSQSRSASVARQSSSL